MIGLPSSPGDIPARVRRVRWTRLAVRRALVLAVVASLTTASGTRPACDVTTDGVTALDLAPFGTVQIDSPLPVSPGALLAGAPAVVSTGNHDSARTAT